MNQSYRPINTACINPSTFPGVALYVQSGFNYVLYKPADRQVTAADLERLAKNQVEYLYIGAGDLQEVSDFLEATLSHFMGQQGLDPRVKGQVLHQVAMNYVMDIFGTPDKISDLERCRNLIRQLVAYIVETPNAMEMLHAVVDHNYYLFIHSVHVASLSMMMHARVFNLPLYELEDVGVGGILHDVGMLFIPNSILDKADMLSDFEYNLIKRHAQRGYECLKEMGGLSEISLAAVRFHHERYNGGGYPFRLEGDEIPRTAQVMSICDVYSALTSNRPYRNAATPRDAVALMESVGERVFNPGLLEQFKELVLSEPRYY